MPHDDDRSAKIKRAAGCVVYARDADGALSLLLIHDQYDCWTIPKGHLEDGESDAEAAVREVWEETGVRGVLGPLVGRIAYEVRTRRGHLRPKTVAFFLMRADVLTVTPQAAEGIRAAEWFAPEAALARAGYAQVREVLAQAIGMLEGGVQ
jgi:8-oxo-dGTP pyrophosphatase MutT (NUDIX family)